MIGQLAAALKSSGSAMPKHVLPRAASVHAVPVQLGFDGVRGFGLDGLGIDLSHFDALRPSDLAAHVPPGYWPVRLLPARQPHRRLAPTFELPPIDFMEMMRVPPPSHAPPDADALTAALVRRLQTANHDGASTAAASATAATPPTKVQLTCTAGGLLNAIVFWFELHVAGCDAPSQCTVSSAPPELGTRGGVAGGWSEGWRQAACYLARPTYVVPGDQLTLSISIEADRISFGLVRVDRASERHEAPAAPVGQEATGGGGGNGGDGGGAAAAGGSHSARARVDRAPRVGVRPRMLHLAAALPINAYHFCMVADTARNIAYRSAIEVAVAARPQCHVLDIGAGTGLLGVIASRAGASRIDCIEMNDALSVTARRTLEASGVPNSHVWHRISMELELDSTGQLGPPRRADIIVSEILDSGVRLRPTLTAPRCPPPSPPLTLSAPAALSAAC